MPGLLVSRLPCIVLDFNANVTRELHHKEANLGLDNSQLCLVWLSTTAAWDR